MYELKPFSSDAWTAKTQDSVMRAAVHCDGGSVLRNSSGPLG